jgi:hypothetical protein
MHADLPRAVRHKTFMNARRALKDLRMMIDMPRVETVTIVQTKVKPVTL